MFTSPSTWYIWTCDGRDGNKQMLPSLEQLRFADFEHLSRCVRSLESPSHLMIADNLKWYWKCYNTVTNATSVQCNLEAVLVWGVRSVRGKRVTASHNRRHYGKDSLRCNKRGLYTTHACAVGIKLYFIRLGIISFDGHSNLNLHAWEPSLGPLKAHLVSCQID